MGGYSRLEGPSTDRAYPNMIEEVRFAPDSALEGDGFEPSVPRLLWSLVQLAARDATDAAIAKPGTPIVRVDELGERFPHAWRAFHTDKSRRRARDRASATSSDRICHQEEGQIADESGFLITAETSLIARFNSLQGR